MHYKHIFLKERPVIAEAVSNYIGNGLWAFFYDLDGYLPVFEETEFRFTRRTKHGSQLVDLTPRSLNQVKVQFNIAKHDWPKTDYFWSVPLWLRISPKWDYEYGYIISPEPDGRPIPLRMKKLYMTWD